MSVGGSSTLPRIIARTATAILLLVAVLVPSAGEVAVAQPPPGAVVPSPGCGTSDAPVETEVRHDLVISGTDRWYLRTVPPVHDGTTPLPLVVDFHGFSEGATIHTAMSEFSGVAIDEGFAVVFPQGQFNPVRWDLDTDVPQNLDVQFVDAMLDALGDDLCLDLSRVYAAGLSYGAWMTWFMNCHRSDVFAAIAPVAGVADFDPCPRSRAVPAVTFHGTDDPILPFDEAAVAARATDNGCDGHTDEDLTDEVILRVFDCPSGADVEFYIVVGGGHAWPGSAFSRLIEAVVGYTTFDIHASRVAWSFFERFRLPCESTDTCPPDLPPATNPQVADAGARVTPAPPPTGSMTAPAPARATAAEPVGEAPSYTG